MASNNHNAFASSMPLGRVSEHLDYFNDSIAAKHCILDGDFDDIFGADFDLVFDPDLILGTAGADHSREQRPHQVGQGHEQHQQRQQQQHFPLPVAVCSSSFVPPPTSIPRHDHSNVKHPAAQHAGDAVVSPASATPPVTAKPMVKLAGKTATSTRNTAAAATTTKSIIRKTAPAVPSPTSVTAVFESIPTPKSSPRKRSVSAVEECNAASFSDRDESNLSFQEQEDLRRERNRHHAKRSRQRKRDYMTQLEDAVNDMRKENERLFDLLGMDSNRAKADMNEEHERKKLAATERFVAALKQPRNRVLDNTTLAFLRELWK